MLKKVKYHPIYCRLKGHRKVNAKAECICGKQMFHDKRFVSYWACKDELKQIKEIEHT